MIQTFVRLIRAHANRRTDPVTAREYLKNFTLNKTKTHLEWLKNLKKRGA